MLQCVCVCLGLATANHCYTHVSALSGGIESSQCTSCSSCNDNYFVIQDILENVSFFEGDLQDSSSMCAL